MFYTGSNGSSENHFSKGLICTPNLLYHTLTSFLIASTVAYSHYPQICFSLQKTLRETTRLYTPLILTSLQRTIKKESYCEVEGERVSDEGPPEPPRDLDPESYYQRYPQEQRGPSRDYDEEPSDRAALGRVDRSPPYRTRRRLALILGGDNRPVCCSINSSYKQPRLGCSRTQSWGRAEARLCG